MQPFVSRRHRQGKLASREGQRIVPCSEMNGTAEELLELRDLVVARVTEPDLAGTQPGVGEKSEGSNEVRGSKLDGLVSVRPAEHRKAGSRS